MNVPGPAATILPMQAADGALPVGSAWGFEFVWDGLRAVVHLTRERAKIFSGTGRPITAGYPELRPLRRLAERSGPLVLDGKIVTPDGLGRPSLAPLRQRMNHTRPSAELVARVPVQFYLADVLHAGDESTLSWPFRRRRELLESLDLTGLPVELPPCFLDTDGQIVLHAAERHGLAGVVAKRLDSRYQPGRRTRAWVQTLPRQSQLVVVGGWLPRAGPRAGAEARRSDPDAEPAAVLVGVPDQVGTLRYLGKVNHGLDPLARARLREHLGPLAQHSCAFVDAPVGDLAGARWLKPRLVGEVSFRRWREDGRLRQAGWLGLRPDERPASVRPPLLAPAVTGNGRTAAGELAALDEGVRLAEAQRRAMRAHVSQHFLYNSLTTIASYVRTDPDQARELLYDFAEFTRYTFRTESTTSTLGAELANVDRYLALEGARFGDRLRVRRDVPDELLDVGLPFLTVQSLVENAVRHGIEGTPRGGTLHIRAERLDDAHCALTVADDGPGRDPGHLGETVAEVRQRLAEAPGPAGSLDVVSADGAGTTVTVRLPIDPGRLKR